MPRKLIQLKLLDPVGLSFWSEVSTCIKHKAKKMSQGNDKHKKLNDSELFFHLALFCVFNDVSEIYLELFILAYNGYDSY
jgi:hypothetical protein